MSKISQQIIKIFDDVKDEYLHENKEVDSHGSDNQTKIQSVISHFDSNNEETLIKNFLASHSDCQKSCFDALSFDEIAKARKQFRELRFHYKNVFMLSQLNLFARHSDQSHSGRQTRARVRQKFDYHDRHDRPVCFDIFLFYHGETVERLKRLQKQKLENGVSNIAHGNSSLSPVHACSGQDKDDIKIFITNYAAAHGMPDPVRYQQNGNGQFRMERTSVLNYISVHRAYESSLQSQNKPAVGYGSFIHDFQELCPHIVFNKPRTDLCMTCEDYKKQINQIAADER